MESFFMHRLQSDLPVSCFFNVFFKWPSCECLCWGNMETDCNSATRSTKVWKFAFVFWNVSKRKDIVVVFVCIIQKYVCMLLNFFFITFNFFLIYFKSSEFIIIFCCFLVVDLFTPFVRLSRRSTYRTFWAKELW